MKQLGVRSILATIMAFTAATALAQPSFRKKPSVVPGEVVVKYKAGIATASAAASLQTFGVTVIKTSELVPFMVGKFSASNKLESVLAAVRAMPDVEYAEPNYKVYALPQAGAPPVFPADGDFTAQWSLHQTSDNDIDAPEAWAITIGSDSIIVGVIDTGIDYDHEDLKSNIWMNPGESGDKANNGQDDDGNGYTDDVRGWNFAGNNNNPFDDNDHGTHVAGIIGAAGNNGKGVVGVNWKVKLMALKFLGSDGSGSTADAAAAIIYAVDHGAKVLNNSWGGGDASQTLQDAIAYADSHGVLFVAAAGNDSNDNDSSPTYPSNYTLPNVISVAASDLNDQLASYSNYGWRTVDLVAPGSSIYNARPLSRYQRLSGTSMATPHVAGAYALVWAKYPQLTSNEVRIRIAGSVDRKPAFLRRVTSSGRLNLVQAFSTNPIIANTTDRQDSPNTIGPYLISAEVVDDDSVTRVLLVYKVNNGRADSLQMKPAGRDKYSAPIPGKPLRTAVGYHVLAWDNQNHVTSSPLFGFKVGEVQQPEKEACCGKRALSLQGLNPAAKLALELPLNCVFFLLPIMLLKRKGRNSKTTK